MPGTVRIEDIEEMRVRVGIDDVELRKDVRGLAVGDLVYLTLLFGSNSAETLPVRITDIHGRSFRGRLDARPVSPALADLADEEPLAFTAAHIHSVAKDRTAH